MGSERTRTALLTAATGTLGTVALGLALAKIHPWVGAAAALAGLVVVGLLVRRTYRTGPHTPWAQARAGLDAGHAVVLWKPTCLYCERLLRAVGADPRVTWVNVWADPAANRAVRDLNDGNELTPTALVGDAVLRNPNGAELLAALGSDAESRDG